MNQLFKPVIYAFAAWLFWGLGLAASAQTEEQIEQLNRERQAFFEEQLDMTPEESKAFWPLYDDYQNRKIRIMEEQKTTFRYSHKNAENLSEEETEETLDKILMQKGQLCDLDQEYYGQKFPAVLPPKKVLLLYKVEWEFRRHLLREIRGKGPDGRGSKRPEAGTKGSPGKPFSSGKPVLAPSPSVQLPAPGA